MPSAQLRDPDSEDPLPRVCMRCGEDATVVRKQTFLWQPMSADIGQAISVVLRLAGLIVWRGDSMRAMKVPVPLCAKHKNLFLWPALLQYGGLLLFLLLGVLLVLAAISGPDSLDEIRRRGQGLPPDGRKAWTGLVAVTFLLEPIVWLGALVIVRWRGIRATEITDRSITLANVSQKFADEIEDRR